MQQNCWLVQSKSHIPVFTYGNGAVIIDLAALQGGNCELSKMNKTVIHNGVKIIGTTIAPESVSTNASDLFAKNMFNFLTHLNRIINNYYST